MIEGHEDRELREEFEALRSELERSGRVPDFDAMMQRARSEAEAGPMPVDELAARRRRRSRIGGYVTLATAAAAAALIFVVDRESRAADAEFERLVASYTASAASGAFASPTSGLLEIPGVDLGSVPAVGGPLQGLDLTSPRPVPGVEGRDS